ncbi:MAG: helix-turn-helix domain-containing protein [Candidatus Omnitrophota bacterium]|nr:helix-turn-helix domain-containing protein [Candidatus Omnitrophota bacterium]
MEKRFVGVRELAEYLGLTRGTLYVWVCHRKIPYHKFGGAVRFDLREIEGWAKENRVKELC